RSGQRRWSRRRARASTRRQHGSGGSCGPGQKTAAAPPLSLGGLLPFGLRHCRRRIVLVSGFIHSKYYSTLLKYASNRGGQTDPPLGNACDCAWVPRPVTDAHYRLSPPGGIIVVLSANQCKR